MSPNIKFGKVSFTFGAIITLLISLSVAISVGSVPVHLSTVWSVILNKLSPEIVKQTWSKGREAIIWDIRFPRALLSMMVGSGLAIVGASLQAVTRNPLADPHLLGISSGAAFGAILALLHTGLFIGLLTVPLFAFMGALVATIIILGVSRFTGATSADRLILTGVAVSFVIMAGANILIFLGDVRATHTVVFWMLGGLGFAQWTQLIYPFVILLFCGAWIFSQVSILNAMTVGDETAYTLGIQVARFRLIVFFVCALITGVMVAFSGIIGFGWPYGLLIIVASKRMLFGGDYIRVIPLSAILGAHFSPFISLGQILPDCSNYNEALLFFSPEDIPIGIVTGLVGGAFFIWLLGKK